MTSWLEAESEGRNASHPPGGMTRTAGRILAACMLLLAAAAGGLVLTRPVHRIEGDFLQREDLGLADEWLGEQLRNPVAETRARAYLALSRIEGRRSLEALLPGMRDAAPSVRAAAAFAAGNVLDSRLGGGAPPDGAVAALLGLLDDDARLVATRAVEALGKAGRVATTAELTRSAAPVAVTMTALMRLDAQGQTAFVAEYLDSDDQDSRWAASLAVDSLGLVREPAVRQRLLPLITDDNAFVRAAALRAAAGAVAGEGLLEAVRASLAHRDPKVRFEADVALAALEGSPQADALPPGEPDLGSQRIPAPDTPLLASGDYQRVAKTMGARLRMSTSDGDFEIELDYERAPLTAEHFRELANAGALDGSVVSAVRPNGYAVAGIPLGPLRSELNPAPFLRGSLGLLRQGDASGGGFFLCLTALPLADGRYVNFGRLVSGDARLDGLSPGTRVLSVREVR